MNYYEILGVAKNATKDDIKRAFKKLVVKYHPDKNADNPQANEFFMLISEAYQTISDDNKRANYDYIFINKTAFNTQERYNDNSNNSSYTYYQKYEKPRNRQTIVFCFILFFVFYCISDFIVSNSNKSKQVSKLESQLKLQENELLYFRNIIIQETEPHKNEILLKKMKGATNHALGNPSSIQERNQKELFFGVLQYKTIQNQGEYLFLLGVLEYKAGKKELALKHFEIAKTGYKKADWYYYVGISQAETQKDKTNACTNLKIAAEMGEAKAKVALASYCQ